MDKDKLELSVSVARSYYQYHLPVREIMAKMSLSKTSVYRILSNFAADNPKMVNEMKQSATPEDLSNENLELKKRLAALEKAKMAAAAYDKMIDIAERLYKIPVRKKSGPKQ